jgi:YidC/Oxa1 family membrane protein insertase
MATSGPTSGPTSSGDKQISMEVRLLIAFLLMGLVIFVTPYFYKQTQPPATKQEAKQETKQDTAKQPAATPAPAPAQVKAAEKEIPGAVSAENEETVVIETDLMKVTFSNRGAVVRSWLLKGFKEHSGNPLDLVNQKALAKVPAPFAIQFRDQAPQPDANAVLFKVERPDDHSVEFQYSDGHLAVKKSFKFTDKSYLVPLSSDVTLNGTPIVHSLEWRGGFGDSTVVKPEANEHSIYYDVANAKLNTKDAKDAKNGPVVQGGQFSFAGLNDQYFAGVFLSSTRTQMDLTVFSDNVLDADNKEQQMVGAAVGGEGSNSFNFFAGPKDMDLLRTVDPKLDQLIDWGWFGIIAKPLFLVLNYTAHHIVQNYGWAIILVTIAINIVLFPLRITSMKSSRKMQAIQPQVAALNAKYKGLKMNDPKKAEQNQALMDLYKEHGINPVGGCLPMLLQLPFVIAFYKVLAVTIEMRGASWLWIHDLSQPETIAIRILPVLLIITQFLQQKMTPSPGMDPTQQKMMLIMPLFLGYVFWFYASGLVLYWLTGNLVGILQQLALNRLMPSAAPPPVKAGPPQKRK